MTTIETLIDFIIKSYSKRNFWVLFGGICLCLVGFGMASILIGVGHLIDNTNQRIQLLDTLFYYSQETAYQQLKAYGEYGREVCLFSTLVLDSFFPLIYGAFWAILLGKLLGKTTYRWLVLLPLLVIIIDYLENTHTAILLINFPEVCPLVVYWGSIFTMTKWLLIALVMLSISFGFFLRNRKNFILEINQED